MTLSRPAMTVCSTKPAWVPRWPRINLAALHPAPNRFPSAADGVGFKPLADKLHSMGLKFGIHVMRGIPRQAVLANTKILGGQFSAVDAGDPDDKCGWCPDMFGVRNNAAGQ